MEVKVIDGVRTFVFKREPVEVKPVSKASMERDRKAKTGRGLAKVRNAARKPSPVTVITY